MLRSVLSFCEVDGRLIFLDLEADRYFMLGRADGDLVRGSIGRPPAAWPASLVSRLGALGLLATAPDAGVPLCPAPHPGLPADRCPLPPSTMRLGTVATLLWRVATIRRRLARGQLAMLIAAQRNRRPPLHEKSPSSLAAALADFGAARALVPIRYNCLLDSLALGQYLAASGQCSTLVMGVRLAPFGAHAWVQRDGALLNDDGERVASFTPILVA